MKGMSEILFGDDWTVTVLTVLMCSWLATCLFRMALNLLTLDKIADRLAAEREEGT